MLLVGALAAAALTAAWPSTTEAKDAREATSHRRTAASVGIASVYARKFFGRRMANGAPMRPDEHNAASVTLPLGSAALVTNLANGARTVVTITDRGPFVRGRIIDLSPHTARQLGIRDLARVEVAPLTLPSTGRIGADWMLADADRHPDMADLGAFDASATAGGAP